MCAHGVVLRPAPLLSADDVDALRGGTARRRVTIVLAARRRLRSELGRVEDAEIVVIQRQVDLLPGRGLEHVAMRGRAMVLDIDDAVWLPEPGGHPVALLRRPAEKLRWLAGRADRVIAGNEYLADWLSQHSRDVCVVPSLVDTDRLGAKAHVPSERLVLGWVGSSSTARYLAAIAGSLSTFAASHPRLEVQLVSVGGIAPSIPGVRVENWRWSEQREADALALMDIGLMPLPDNPWTRGKCAYKALQYMAAGIPVVADDVGPTGLIVGDGSAGFLVRRSGDWARHLTQLATSAELRTTMGAAGRARVVSDFSVQRWGRTLAALIAGAG